MMAKSEIDTTNDLIRNYNGAPVLVFLTGASGAGKSHLTKVLESRIDKSKAHFAYFDDIGVPSVEEMVKDYGSGEKWQEAKTYEWIAKLSNLKDKALIILEGQYNPNFVVEGCSKAGIDNFLLLVADCDDATREERLSKMRNQPELVNDDMRNWARYLSRRTLELGGAVIDTSSYDVSFAINSVARIINTKLVN